MTTEPRMSSQDSGKPDAARDWFVSIAFLLTSFLVMSWSVGELRSANRSLTDSSASLRACRKLGFEISQLTSQPRMASFDVESPQQMIQHVTDSISRAEIPRSALVSVLPSEALRIGSSDYQQRQTQLQLRGVSLPLLAEFYNALEIENGLYLRDIILTEGTDNSIASNGSEIWDARLILTQLIYSPTSR